LQRFFNKPAVLVALFVVTVGLIVWAFWPANPDAMFQQGAALMNSPNTDDWYRGIELVEESDRKDPEHKHQAEVAEFRKQYDELQARRKAEALAKSARPPGEAEYFYRLGLRQRQQGKEQEARATWRLLVDAFKGVPSEEAWVKLAEDALQPPADPAAAPERHLETVEAAVTEAKRLRAENKPEEADKIRRALEKLYGDDPAARKLLDK
jgi:hypothetical protein